MSEVKKLTVQEKKECYQECLNFWEYMKKTNPDFIEQYKRCSLREGGISIKIREEGIKIEGENGKSELQQS